MEYPDISHYESKIPQEMNQEDGGMLSNIGNYLYEGAGKFNKMHNTVIRNPVLKALGGFADIPNLAAQGLEGLGRGQAESERRKFQMMGLPGSDIETPEINALSSNIPTYQDATTLLKDTTGIDLEAEPEDAAGRLAANMVGTGTSYTPFGLLGKAPGLKKAFDLTKLGGVVGGGSSVLKEGGVDDLTADLASTVVSPYAATKLNPNNLLNAFRKLPETVAKVPIKLMGLSPKSLNIPAAKAARDINVDLSADALTSSALTGLADQWIGKTPFFGNALKNKAAKTMSQIENSIEGVLNTIGPETSPETKSRINKIYESARQSLPEKATILPSNLEKQISSIEFKSLVPTPDEILVKEKLDKLNKIINPTSSLYSPFGNIKMPPQKINVDELVASKVSLNNLSKWDTDEGVKKILQRVNNAIGRDITEYGKSNPEWYKKYKEANTLYGDMAKRASFQKILDPTVNAATETLSYNALSKALNSKKNQKTLRRLEPETFEKIQKIGTVARAMAQKAQRVPNPSGTAITGATMGLVGMIFTNPMALLTGSGVGGVIGAGVGSKLLTDKKFIDLALKLAETPNKPNLVTTAALNKRIKQITGSSALALSKRINENGEDK